jgi:hypothetical protein
MSLKSAPELTSPDLISAVGDDSITRFDKPRKKGGKSRGGRNKGRGGNRPKSKETDGDAS